MSDTALTAHHSVHPVAYAVTGAAPGAVPVSVQRRVLMRRAARGAVALGLTLVAAVALQSPLLVLLSLFMVRRLLWGGYRAGHLRRRAVATASRAAPALAAAPSMDPNRRAVLALTGDADAPLYQRARERGLSLVSSLSEMESLLGDGALNDALRQPLDERRVDIEAELQVLLGALSRAASGRRKELTDWFEAQAEIEAIAPAYSS